MKVVNGGSFVLCIFFFKQKTAYEMRISDWSSDVCSSDLRHLYSRDERFESGLRCGTHRQRGEAGRGEQRGADVAHAGDAHQHQPDGDRKSGVSGKSVSVRVDLGGRSITKK